MRDPPSLTGIGRELFHNSRVPSLCPSLATLANCLPYQFVRLFERWWMPPILLVFLWVVLRRDVIRKRAAFARTARRCRTGPGDSSVSKFNDSSVRFLDIDSPFLFVPLYPDGTCLLVVIGASCASKEALACRASALRASTNTQSSSAGLETSGK